MSGQFTAAETDPALTALRRAGASPQLLLHSGRAHSRWARRSLRAAPRAWFRAHAGGLCELVDARDGKPLPAADRLTGHVFSDLAMLLADPQFSGGWLGYLSYDLGRLLEPGKLGPPDGAGSSWPLVELGWCPDMQTFPAPTEWAPPVAPVPAPAPPASWTCNFSDSAYRRAVSKVLDYIAAGDVFQVNLARRLSGSWRGQPRDLFARLAAASPAWYGAYLELPGGRVLCSTSPELFLEVDGDQVTTRPIKGTRPADVDPQELRDSEKDRAELNMIVDLMRNDLGRVCDYGSVRVAEARELESHPTVHHTVATIQGRLHKTKNMVDLLKAALPGGSVTGAPKVRAMQIIDELEPDPRGPYCGCIGYLSADHALLNIAIRTIVLDPSADGGDDQWQASFSVGGGIVADSDPAAELQETTDKAQAMLRALGCDSDAGT